MNLSRRELFKLGGAALIAPLVRRIPDSELPEHPLLSPVHKDIPTHGGIHEIPDSDIYTGPSLSEAMIHRNNSVWAYFWTNDEMYVSRDLGFTWELICTREPWQTLDSWEFETGVIAEILTKDRDLAV